MTDHDFPVKIRPVASGNETSWRQQLNLAHRDCLLKSLIRILSVYLIFTCLHVLADEDTTHQHSPIIVRSRPVIERLTLKVIAPADVVTTDVATFVADSVGKMIFRIDSEDQTSVVAQQLEGLNRIAAHRLGNFALLSGKRSGQIVQFTENGFIGDDPISLNFAPAGLAFDDHGDLWTGNSARGEIYRFTKEGESWSKKLIRVSEPVVDLILDRRGNPTVLLRSGKMVTVQPAEPMTATVTGYVPESASRLSLHPEEGVVALAKEENFKSALFKPTAHRNETDRYAKVPEATSSVAFDSLGNLICANSEWRALTRVTSRFKVPCPHCGIPVPMIFSPDAPAAKQAQRRSF